MAIWYPLALATAIVLLAASSDAQTVPGGRETCSKDRLPCLDSPYSTCKDDTCQCVAGYRGVPQLGCQPKGHHVCALLNDPQGIPFSGGPGIDIPLPCRYLATYVKVSVPEENFWCSTRVYAYGRRFNGKFFLHGYDVRLDWQLSGQSQYTLSIKAYGKNRADGSFEWDLLTRHSRFLGGKKWQRDDIGLDVMDEQLGGTNIFGVDKGNNRVQMISTKCGINTAFRLYDPLQPVQPDTPGLVVGVNPDAGEVSFLQTEGSVCLTTELTHLEAAKEVHTTANIEASTVFRVAALRRGQSFPGGDTYQCTQLKDELQQYKDNEPAKYIGNGLNRCLFILSKPHFVNCVGSSVNSGEVIELYRKCMGALCTNDRGLCRNFQGELRDTGCGDKDVGATAILAGTCELGDLLVP